MKKIALALVVLIVLGAACGYYLYYNLDHIIKTAIEKYGSEATQASVQLDSVKLALTTGDGTLSGLSITNPKGFSTPKAFYLGSIAVKVDTSSIRGTGPIIVQQVIIDQPQVTYELLNNGDSNLQTIQNNAVAYAKSFQNADTPKSPTAGNKVDAGNTSAGRKIIINTLTIHSGQVAISQEMLNGRQLSASLPEIHMTNIGKGSGGATAAQVAQQILSAITNAAAQSSVTELAKEKISGLLNLVPVKAIGGAAADTVGSQLKGVFGQ